MQAASALVCGWRQGVSMDAAEVSRRLAERADEVARYLLPGGKLVGGEWRCGSVRGEPGRSLGVCLRGGKRGLWADFSSGQSGDLLDLWQAVRGLGEFAAVLAEARDYLGIRVNVPVREARAFKPPVAPRATVLCARVRGWLAGRGITAATAADFAIYSQAEGQKLYAVFPYLRAAAEGGALVNTKLRNIAEKRDMRQAAGAEPCLFGWQRVPAAAREVVITEGELDCLTLAQWGVAALSVNAGAGNHQWIAGDWERLQRFSTIYLCFDGDAAGEKGVAEVARRLGLARCRIIRLGAHKDANALLMAGGSAADFLGFMQAAASLDPVELRRLADYREAVTALFYPGEEAVAFPVLTFCGRDQAWFEFRPAELTVWTGYNGHGKTLCLGQVLAGLMVQGQSVCVFSGEMRPDALGRRLLRQLTGLGLPSRAYLDEAFAWLAEKMWIFDLLGCASVDRLLEVFTYAHLRYGITQFVIDSLMTTDVLEDGMGAITSQKEAVRRLKAFAHEQGVHVHLVAHPRKGGDESQPPGKLDVAGSGKITDLADNVFSVWSRRRPEGEEGPEPDALVELHKQRNGEVQYRKLPLWFKRESQQYFCESRRGYFGYVAMVGNGV